jgi:3-hydroxyacyl-[acyl-carrier-protein] dehydratase
MSTSEQIMSENPVPKNLLDVKEVIKILPHRYPFLLVDKIVEMDLDKGYILGQKNVTINESFFQGHFPDAPIMPGVLILEALAQAGGVMVHLKANNGKIAVLLNVNNAKFRNPVRPGDVLFLRGEGIHFSANGGKVKVTALVNNKIAVEAEIGFALVNKSQI